MTMQTADLEMETCLAEALGTAANAIGRKRLAHLLWPEKSSESGQKALADCLHADRRDKFSIEQIDLIVREARQAECHAVMRYFARAFAYRDPVPITPENEIERLLRENANVQKRLQESNHALERALGRYQSRAEAGAGSSVTALSDRH